MGKNNRWMTWVLEESARINVTMPWARGTRPDWQKRLATEAPELSNVIQSGMTRADRARRSVTVPRQAAMS